MSLRAEQFTTALKGFLQSAGRLGRMQKRFSDAPLVLNCEPDDLRLFDRPASGSTGSRDNKIRKSTSQLLDLECAAKGGAAD